jgi:hypothetical protein
MKARNISVTFHVDIEASKPWFRVPKSIADVFGLKGGDVVAVSTSTPQGELLYHILLSWTLAPNVTLHISARFLPKAKRLGSPHLTHLKEPCRAVERRFHRGFHRHPEASLLRVLQRGIKPQDLWP